VDVIADLEARAAATAVFAQIDDLARYPEWLGLVSRATPAEPHPDDDGPAWSIDLRARLGPLARAKRLRMVRTRHEPPRHATFERREHDGRDHSEWILRAEIDPDVPAAGSSRLTMHLHYGGSLLGAVGERLLRDEIERSRPRFVALVEGEPS
jgi:hypothetical protein